ncbi:MAG: hypothetical protein IPL89_13855 [Acidobacteria bacterium]|nr:hypothetical protein [Acidobacteriota bacterium]
MSRNPLGPLALALSLLPNAAPAQTPVPRPPGRGKELTIKVTCPASAPLYGRLDVLVSVMETGGMPVQTWGWTEKRLTLDGGPIAANCGGDAFGVTSVCKIEVPPLLSLSAHTITARLGAFDGYLPSHGACTFDVKKAPSALALAASEPSAMQGLNVPGAEFRQVVATLSSKSPDQARWGQTIRFWVNGQEKPPAKTDAAGKATMLFKATQVQNTVRAAFDGDGLHLGSTAELAVRVVDEAGIATKLRLEPSLVAALPNATSIRLRATLERQMLGGSQPVPGKTIRFYNASGPPQQIGSATTDGNGRAEILWTTPPGSGLQFEARWGGDMFAGPSTASAVPSMGR